MKVESQVKSSITVKKHDTSTCMYNFKFYWHKWEHRSMGPALTGPNMTKVVNVSQEILAFTRVRCIGSSRRGNCAEKCSN